MKTKSILLFTFLLAGGLAPAQSISQLPAGSAVSDTDLFPVTQGYTGTAGTGATDKVTAAQFKYYCLSGLAPGWSTITGTPTTLAGYGITDAGNGYMAESVSAASATTLSSLGRRSYDQITLGVGSGSYAVARALSDSGARAGDEWFVNVLWPTSVNPTLTFTDAGSGGSLGSYAGTGASGVSTLQFVYTGSAWVHFSKGELDTRNLGTGVQAAAAVQLDASGGLASHNSLAAYETTAALASAIGSTIQAHSANLDSWSALSPAGYATSLASTYVPQTTTVNGHPLSSNVTVSASDITTGTLPHAQLPALLSGDIPNNAANTSGSAGSVTGLSVASGKTLTVSNTITLTAPDGQTYIFPASGDTLAGLGTNNVFTGNETFNGTVTFGGSSTLTGTIVLRNGAGAYSGTLQAGEGYVDTTNGAWYVGNGSSNVFVGGVPPPVSSGSGIGVTIVGGADSSAGLGAIAGGVNIRGGQGVFQGGNVYIDGGGNGLGNNYANVNIGTLITAAASTRNIFIGNPSMAYQTVAIAGTQSSSAASAGYIGEKISSSVGSSSSVSMSTSGQAYNVTSISLTAGDWDVEANCNLSGSSLTDTALVAGISTSSATLPADSLQCYSGVTATAGTFKDTIVCPRTPLLITATTTVYLVSQGTFSAGSLSGFGTITARRVR